MSRSFGDRSVTSRSPIRIRPPLTSSRPASMRSEVVLPQPEGPTRTRNSPSPISRSSLSTAGVVGARVDPGRLVERDSCHHKSLHRQVRAGRSVVEGGATSRPVPRRRCAVCASSCRNNPRRTDPPVDPDRPEWWAGMHGSAHLRLWAGETTPVRHRHPGRGQRGDGQPGAQRQARSRLRHPRRGADRAGRARLRATGPAAPAQRRPDRAGRARAGQPDLPGVRAGDRHGAGLPTATRRCCAPRPRAASTRRTS